MTLADAWLWPDRSAIPPSAGAQIATCNAPSPNTSLRMRDRRSKDNSSPIMNSRNTTPSSAKICISSTSAKVSALMTGERSLKRPSTDGPSSTPAPRKPITGLMRSRRNSGMTTAAVPRKTSASLKWSSATGPAMFVCPVKPWAPLRQRAGLVGGDGFFHALGNEFAQRAQVLGEQADAFGQLLGRHRVFVEQQPERLLVERHFRGRRRRRIRGVELARQR